MCITSEPAKLSGTILLAHSFTDADGNTQNLIGYKNKPKSLRPGGNCMIFAIPALAGSKVEVIDMTDHHDLLKDYAELFQGHARGTGTKGLFLSLSDRSVEIVERGSYTVVIASHASDVPAALAMVKPGKRPRMNQALFDGLESLYGAWEQLGGKRFVIACWAGDIDPEPILLHYRPIPAFEGLHILPGLDAHDGKVPVPGKLVEVDHTIVVGLAKNAETYSTDADWVLRNVPSDLRAKLPRLVIGREIDAALANGDWVIPKNVVNTSLRDFTVDRINPPGPATPPPLPIEVREGKVTINVNGVGEWAAQLAESQGKVVERVVRVNGEDRAPLDQAEAMLTTTTPKVPALDLLVAQGRIPVAQSSAVPDPITSITVRDSARRGHDYNDLLVVHPDDRETEMVVPKVHTMALVTRLMGGTRLVADMKDTGITYTRP